MRMGFKKVLQDSTLYSATIQRTYGTVCKMSIRIHYPIFIK